MSEKKLQLELEKALDEIARLHKKIEEYQRELCEVYDKSVPCKRKTHPLYIWKGSK